VEGELATEDVVRAGVLQQRRYVCLERIHYHQLGGELISTLQPKAPTRPHTVTSEDRRANRR
jgi:hypothetical protein